MFESRFNIAIFLWMVFFFVVLILFSGGLNAGKGYVDNVNDALLFSIITSLVVAPFIWLYSKHAYNNKADFAIENQPAVLIALVSSFAKCCPLLLLAEYANNGLNLYLKDMLIFSAAITFALNFYSEAKSLGWLKK